MTSPVWALLFEREGPTRAAAIAAAAASLQRDVGVCGDRARAVATHAIDAAAKAAQEASHA